MDKYAEEPPYYAAEAYDIIKIYARVMQKGINSEIIKSNLYGLKDFEGASGIITFDENGDCIKPFEIGQVQDRKLVPLKII